MKSQLFYENQSVTDEEKIHVDFRTCMQVFLVSVFFGPVIALRDTFLCFKRFLLAEKIRNQDESAFAQNRMNVLLEDVKDHSVEMIMSGLIVFMIGVILYFVLLKEFPDPSLLKIYPITGIVMISEGIMFIWLIASDE